MVYFLSSWASRKHAGKGKVYGKERMASPRQGKGNTGFDDTT